MSDAIQIREARLDDLHNVSMLLAEAKLVALEPDSQFGPQYAVATSADQIIGVAGVELHGEDGLLRSVCLHPDFRSLRVGAALVDNRIDWAREHSLRALYLLTTTASGYWPRFGFRAISRQDAPAEIAKSLEWSSACPAEPTAMRLAL